MKHVVIAGAGFAGVRLARKLRKYKKQIRVTLINDTPDFRYSPALYRAATGFKMGTARIPLEWMLLDSSNTRLVIDTVTSIDKGKRQLLLASGQRIDYDYVVFGLGAVTTYFNIKGLSQRAFGIKTPEEVQTLKHHIHDSLTNPKATQQNFVIVGAGPTGVELAGALGSYARSIMHKHRVKQSSNITIFLVEASPRILPQMSKKAAQGVHDQLHRLGVQILTNTTVRAETGKYIKTSNGNIHSHNVVWTAGTTNNPLFSQHPKIFKLGNRGKVKVNQHLQAGNTIYVMGDNADTKHSGLALTAIRHANYLAREITARVHRSKRPVLHEKTPTQVVPVSEKWAVLQHGPLVIRGRVASWIRKLADIVGYTDVLGLFKAATIWSNSDQVDIHCDICGR